MSSGYGADTFRNTGMTSRMEPEDNDLFSNTMPSTFNITQGIMNCRDTTFSKKAKKEGYDLVGVTEHLPCSLEAVDNLHEIFIEGKSKLDQEVKHA